MIFLAAVRMESLGSRILSRKRRAMKSNKREGKPFKPFRLNNFRITSS